MKLLSLIPKIMAVEPAVNWTGTKVENKLFIYPFEPDFETRCLEAAEENKPELIIMFAFGEGPYSPSPDKIRLIRDKFPIVYIATDGACRGLWPILRRFKHAECFSKIVNIDGSHHSPPGLVDLVTLSPLDQGRYSGNRKYLKDRTIQLGFMGGEGAVGNLRRDICDALLAQGILTRGKRDESWGSNPAYTDFMLDCRAVINFPYSGLGHFQVKARALETGLSGAMLLEHTDGYGSILDDYFTPEEDYMEFKSIDDVVRILDMPLQAQQAMGDRFRQKVLPLTDPDLWVEKVMNIL